MTKATAKGKSTLGQAMRQSQRLPSLQALRPIAMASQASHIAMPGHTAMAGRPHLSKMSVGVEQGCEVKARRKEAAYLRVKRLKSDEAFALTKPAILTRTPRLEAAHSPQRLLLQDIAALGQIVLIQPLQAAMPWHGKRSTD
jgi:hypothetical protein